MTFFDLDSGVNVFTIDDRVPSGLSVRALAGSDVLIGSANADTVFGNDGVDFIAGFSGADDLQGGRSRDLLFGNDGADRLQGQRGNDVQGNFGNCAFLAALGATFGKIEDPNAVNSAMSTVLGRAITMDGTNFTLRFYDFLTGQAQTVTVNNNVVTNPSNNLLFGAKWADETPLPSDASGQPIWASVFERAYAKWRGEQTGRNGYDVVGNGDYPGVVLKRVTGRNVETIDWDPQATDPNYQSIDQAEDGAYRVLGGLSADEAFNRLQAALNGGQFAAAGTIDIKSWSRKQENRNRELLFPREFVRSG